MEKTKVLGLMNHACSNCEAKEEDYGHYPCRGKRLPPRNHDAYIQAHNVLEPDANVTLKMQIAAQGVLHRARSRHTPLALWQQPVFSPLADVFKPDILHTLYLGMMKHLMEWLVVFLRKHKRLNAFDFAFMSTPQYPE